MTVVALAAWCDATEIGRPASERFANVEHREVPDFQRHVVPLLGRLGCNGRACHGSFQGQGGFRLSLFGYDFPVDHQSLTEAIGDEGRPRVDFEQPRRSLILQKPSQQLEHEGGRRLNADGWQYQLLLRWIQSGAQPLTRQLRLQRLEVHPREIVFQKPGESRSLRVVAQWEDGTREDVTCLCRFESAEESIAETHADGRVEAKGRGDTHLAIFYDNGVATIPVILSTADRGETIYPEVAASTRVDEFVLAKLRKLSVVPSDICTDAEFLRRLSIDMTGTLPAPTEIEDFLADHSPQKRSKKIDELLDSPAYVAWWSNKLCDITGNSRQRQAEERIGDLLAEQWYRWIHRRVASNVAYDKLVEGIVLALSRREGQSYEEYAAEMSSYLREKNAPDFAQRETLPYFWTRRTVETPEAKVLALAHSFLGIRLQCAQCHKHPYDQWTQHDFQQFTDFFADLSFGVSAEAISAAERLAQAGGQQTKGRYPFQVTQEAAAAAEGGKTVAWRELFVDGSQAKKTRTLKLLGHWVHLGDGEDARRAIMQWMRERDNPYFAQAFVNRVWANYFHIGLVEPVDDLNLANPPSNPELLDYLVDGFVDQGYDMKWLHREITLSDAYQRSWRPNETNRDDRRNFSRAIPRRLQAEVIYDALKQATAAESQLAAVREDLDRRAIGHLSTRMAGTYAQKVFGKPDRLIACDCERSNTPALLQSIFMQNDPLIHLRFDESGWLQEVAAAFDNGQSHPQYQLETLIRSAYLRTVCRPPTNSETARARQYLRESATSVAGLRDLMWALVNSKEFLLNH